MARLGVKSRALSVPIESEMDRLEVWQLPTMLSAVECIRKEHLIWKRRDPEREARMDSIAPRAVSGDEQRLNKSLSDADELIEQTIELDQRLAKKNSWKRCEEGESACAAMLVSGEESPFFKRTKTTIAAAAGGTPIKLVVSTYANEVEPKTAAAFIAAVRIAQQFHPVEVWWQGAWLTEDRRKGFVFHVPLVQEDMDFSRLDFCITDTHRDSLSYCVMTTKAAELLRGWNECATQADRSYLKDTTAFINHAGIKPSAASISNAVCEWLDWPCLWLDQYRSEQQSKAALQEIPEETKRLTMTAAERAAEERWYKNYKNEQAAKDAAAAKARVESL